MTGNLSFPAAWPQLPAPLPAVQTASLRVMPMMLMSRAIQFSFEYSRYDAQGGGLVQRIGGPPPPEPPAGNRSSAAFSARPAPWCPPQDRRLRNPSTATLAHSSGARE